MSNQTGKAYLSRPTGELEEILESTHARDAEKFLKSEAESLLPDDRPFAEYMRGYFIEKNGRGVFVRKNPIEDLEGIGRALSQENRLF